MPVLKKLKKLGVPLYRLPGLTKDFLQAYKPLLSSLLLFDGIKDVLLSLKEEGIHLSILSSNSTENIRSFLQANELEMFDQVMSSKTLFSKNKQMEKYRKDNKLTKDEIIYVGDETRDIDACRIAGMRIISVVWGYESKELLLKEKPDFIAEEPEDILKIIRQLS